MNPMHDNMILDPGKRNMGQGNKFHYAANNVIYLSYGDGRFATRARLLGGGAALATWAKETYGITDIRNFTQDHLEQYAIHWKERMDFDDISISHATNRVSEANRLLAIFFGDGTIWVSPSAFLGKRSYVRTEIPLGYDWVDVFEAASLLAEKGFHREGLVLCLARKTGMRCKEVLLQDYRLKLVEAKTFGKIDITKGTKGGRGRYVERWVPVDDITLMLLEHAALLQGDWKSLVPPELTLVQYRAKFYRAYNPVRDYVGLGRLHDLRAAYACERYFQITGHDAPVIAGKRQAQKEDDNKAREIISWELGHGRTCILANYIGSAK